MEEIFLKWGTDKSTTHSYLEAYESLFSKRRNDELRILEIGIWAGASLLAWAEYFTNENTEIIGIDVSPQPFIAEVSKNPKIKTIIGDATNVQDIELIGGTFDFIIDDGSHRLGDQLRAFKILKNRLRDGGDAPAAAGYAGQFFREDRAGLRAGARADRRFRNPAGICGAIGAAAGVAADVCPGG